LAGLPTIQKAAMLPAELTKCYLQSKDLKI